MITAVAASTGVSEEELTEELLMDPFPVTPATRFIRKRQISQPQHLKGQGLTDYEHQILIDLMESDIPLDRFVRKLVAGELRHLYFPSKGRNQQEETQRQHQELEHAIDDLRAKGMTTDEAAEAVTESYLGRKYGITSAETLQRNLRPSRK
jgi:hypothetical protein